MVDILLSTYQSEKYIEDQINSILNQTYTEWKLIVRDDGSSDGTVQIINKYKSNYPDRVFILDDNMNNIGTVRSFEYLLNSASSEYIMFCDHDDIWLPDKIAMSIAKMSEIENCNPDLPVLIHSDLIVINGREDTIHSSFWHFSNLNPRLLANFNYLGVCNGITGCTMLINKMAKDVSLPFSKYARMHDAWIALCVSKYGKIGYIDRPAVLYRQHEFNQIGAKTYKGLIDYVQVKLLNIKQVVEQNRLQLQMLRDLKYGSVLKYICYKISYFIRTRL